jgi:hypothetical protein
MVSCDGLLPWDMLGRRRLLCLMGRMLLEDAHRQRVRQAAFLGNICSGRLPGCLGGADMMLLDMVQCACGACWK